MAEKAPKVKKQRMRWVSQLRQAYTLGRKGDPRLGWILLAVGLGTFAVFLGLGFLLHSPVFIGILGVMAAITATMFIFGRRVERSVFRQVEGTPGAAMQALSTLRRGFTVDQTPVAVNKQQDLVIRVIGKCGVVLIGEGAPTRVTHMLVAERKRHQRVLGDIPVHELQAGSGEGQIPLRKLSATVVKLPRTLSGAQMTELDHRLKALGVNQGPLPIPKGPLPRGLKIPRG